MEQEVIKIDMPAFQPDCCEECMLLGMRPKEEMKRGDLKPLKCMLTGKAMTKKLSKSRASEHYSLKRPCDNTYSKLFGDGDNYYPMPLEIYQSQVLAYLHKRCMNETRNFIRDYKKYLKEQGREKPDWFCRVIKLYKKQLQNDKEQ